jgi:hypothetical protein
VGGQTASRRILKNNRKVERIVWTTPSLIFASSIGIFSGRRESITPRSATTVITERIKLVFLKCITSLALDGWNNMTDLEINIAIHKSRGFTIVSDGITHCLTPCGPKTEHDPEGYLLKECPDYVNSLDAMHEAEKIIKNTDKWRRYKEELNCMPIDTIHATARQRAEAFLKTIGKWEE